MNPVTYTDVAPHCDSSADGEDEAEMVNVPAKYLASAAPTIRLIAAPGACKAGSVDSSEASLLLPAVAAWSQALVSA